MLGEIIRYKSASFLGHKVIVCDSEARISWSSGARQVRGTVVPFSRGICRGSQLLQSLPSR